MKHTSKGHYSVFAPSYTLAGKAIAQRKAMRMFGPKGRVLALRVACWNPDVPKADCRAFIGYRSGGHTIGRNVRFTVEREA